MKINRQEKPKNEHWNPDFTEQEVKRIREAYHLHLCSIPETFLGATRIWKKISPEKCAELVRLILRIDELVGPGAKRAVVQTFPKYDDWILGNPNLFRD